MSLRAERSNPNYLKRELATAKKVVILGIGSELYDSDSLGLLAAKEIQKLDSSGKYQVFLTGTAPENYTGAIREVSPSHVIFIDAADMGKEPGTIEIIDKNRIASVTISTHDVSLSLLADYLTEDIGCKVIMLGIQPEKDAPEGKTTLVEEAIKQLARLLCQS
jgi:hydrogenase 3 maturation protease